MYRVVGMSTIFKGYLRGECIKTIHTIDESFNHLKGYTPILSHDMYGVYMITRRTKGTDSILHAHQTGSLRGSIYLNITGFRDISTGVRPTIDIVNGHYRPFADDSESIPTHTYTHSTGGSPSVTRRTIDQAPSRKI